MNKLNGDRMVFRLAWMLLGAAHTLFVGAVLHEPLLGMLSDGVWMSVGDDAVRGLAFWSLLFGPAMVAIGLLLPVDRPAPLAVLGLLSGVSVLGTLVFPVSGFALAILVCAAMWVARWRSV